MLGSRLPVASILGLFFFLALVGVPAQAQGCPDADMDGICDTEDNCVDAANPDQLDVDDDNDGVLDVNDCAPLDSSASTRPGEVRDVRVETTPGTQLSWSETSPADLCDVAGGMLGELGSDGGSEGASCFADDLDLESWDDLRPDPKSGEGYYYLVRGESSCGAGTYGEDSAGLERQLASDCP
jgi:hypothetical protein